MTLHMRFGAFAVLLWANTYPVLTSAQPTDDRPILKESPARLVQAIERTIRDSAHGDYVLLIHALSQKNILIFSARGKEDARDVKEQGYHIEVIFNSVLAGSALGDGSFRFQHNVHVLTFAAAQYAAGDRTLAIRLTQILSEVEPTLGWSSPTHDLMSIQQITRGLAKGDDTIKEFVQDQANEWSEKLATYGPSRSDAKQTPLTK